MRTIQDLIREGRAIRGVPVIIDLETWIVSHQRPDGLIVCEPSNRLFDPTCLVVNEKALSEIKFPSDPVS